jgi:hypothetical protein
VGARRLHPADGVEAAAAWGGTADTARRLARRSASSLADAFHDAAPATCASVEDLLALDPEQSLTTMISTAPGRLWHR